jgi:hypothetical protein
MYNGSWLVNDPRTIKKDQRYIYVTSDHITNDSQVTKNESFTVVKDHQKPSR